MCVLGSDRRGTRLIEQRLAAGLASAPRVLKRIAPGWQCHPGASVSEDV